MDLQPLHVLIVEDSENSTILMLRALRQGGYETLYRRVQTENNMRAALQEKSWDLVLSDHDMPGFSAPEALAVLQETGLDIPFIIVSGAIGEELAVAALKSGAHDLIMKSNLSRLLPAVQRELQDAENRRERRKAELELRERYQEIQVLSGRILSAYEEERTRLARELHDEIGQALTVINMDLQYLQVHLPSKEQEFLEKLAASAELARETLNNLRRQIAALRPPALDNIGLVEAVREMAREVGRRSGLSIQLQETGLSRRLPVNIETVLYRIIQEALTNVVRHARAGRVEIKLCREREGVSAEIIDNGVGFKLDGDRQTLGGVGLVGIRERAHLVGGSLEIDSTPGQGTRLFVSVPCSSKEENEE